MKKYLIEVKEDEIWENFVNKIPRSIKNVNKVIVKWLETTSQEEINNLVKKIKEEEND